MLLWAMFYQSRIVIGNTVFVEIDFYSHTPTVSPEIKLGY